MNSAKKDFKSMKLSQNNNNSQRKKSALKNLSPAKKFRLRLRLAKYQKRQQAREEYFEHDTRENFQRRKKRSGKFNRKIKGSFKVNAKQNSFKNDNDDGKQFMQSKNNKNNIPSSSLGQLSSQYDGSLTISAQEQLNYHKEQAKQNETTISSPVSLYHTNTSSDVAVGNFPAARKCCCHCACSGSKRKPRRKLSSPYFGDFSHVMHFAGGTCSNAEISTEILNKTIMTTQHEKFMKASAAQLNYEMYDQPNFIKYIHKPASEKSRINAFKNGIKSVVRFVNLS